MKCKEETKDMISAALLGRNCSTVKSCGKKHNYCSICKPDANYRRGLKKRFLSLFTCKQCKKDFSSLNVDRKFCSYECMLDSNRQNNPWFQKGDALKKERKECVIRGESHYSWKGGPTNINKIVRGCEAYKTWRNEVFERDCYTCKKCKVRGVRLDPNHVKTFSLIMEENRIQTLEEALNCKELWNIDNGETLCRPCHRKTDTYGIRMYWSKKSNNLRYPPNLSPKSQS